jgi:GTP cyclohydrolase IA
MENKTRVYEAAGLLKTKIDKLAIEESVEKILRAIGEDPEREGLLETPERIAAAYEELLAGYRTDPVELISNALFEVDYDDMVLVRDIEFFSLCEHHMLPFMGRAHVAYIPKEKVIGLSKIPRIVDLFSRRLQVQERMTRQVADFLCSTLDPLGAGVVIEALHMCSMMRGVKKHDARMTTSTMVGTFRTNPATRQEFLDSISRGAEPLHF